MEASWLVYYDVQTTGFTKPIHITQIAALTDNGRQFSVYIRPKKPIHRQATKKTGLYMKGRHLAKGGEILPTVSITQGLTQFLNFLSSQVVPGQPLILVNHYSRRYDTPVLLEAAKNIKMEEHLRRCVYGEIDTFIVFKKERPIPKMEKKTPGRVGYSRKALIKRHLGADYEYTENDAREHTRVLKQLVDSQFEDKSKLCPHIKQWELESVELQVDGENPLSGKTLVYYDSQTTGLRDPHITQISALVDEDNKFSMYVMPKKPIEEDAYALNKMRLEQDGRLTKDGEEVTAVGIKVALTQLWQFLCDQVGSNRSVILVDHCNNYDLRRILPNVLGRVGMEEKFKEIVCGEIDTIVVFKKERPSKESFSRKELVRRHLGTAGKYKPYDAREHTRILKQLVDKEFEDKSSLCKYIKPWEKKAEVTDIKTESFLSV